MNKNIIKILLVIILIAILVLLIKAFTPKKETEIKQTVSKTSYSNIKQENEQQNTEPKKLYIKEHKMSNNSISGIVKNNTNNVIKNITITADCYDKDNNKVGTSMDMINELKPGETWKFNMWAYSTATKYRNIKLKY